MNKGISGIIGITFSLLTLSVFSQNELEARWQATPVAADGQTKEWTLPLRFSDSKSGLQYNITHDEANLYICIRVTDRTTQMQVLSSGIKVLIDENGKKKYPVMIQFPVPSRAENKSGTPDPGAGMQQPDRSGMGMEKQKGLQQRFHASNQSIILSGFKPEVNGTFSLQDSRSILAGLDWDEQEVMTCEIIIPDNCFNRDFKTGKQPVVIGLKIQADALETGMTGRPSENGQRPARDMQEQGRQMQGSGNSSTRPGNPPSGGDRPSPPSGSAPASSSDQVNIRCKVRLGGK